MLRLNYTFIHRQWFSFVFNFLLVKVTTSCFTLDSLGLNFLGCSILWVNWAGLLWLDIFVLSNRHLFDNLILRCFRGKLLGVVLLDWGFDWILVNLLWLSLWL